MLAPAGFLVLILLASVSVDSAIAYLGRRQLENAVTAAANDAATVAIPTGDVTGLADGSVQDGAGARPDVRQAQRIATQAVMHPYSGGLTATEVNASVDGQEVVVTATGTVSYIFAKAIPGMRHHSTVKAQASADVRFR
jgi:Flp pilus assembly protein TadG